MTDIEKREKLRGYLLAVSRLKRMCREADTWRDLSCGHGGTLWNAPSRGQRTNPDTIKETALTLRNECERMAIEVNALRLELTSALDSLSNDQYREILEAKYLDGLPNEALQKKFSYTKRHILRLQGLAIRALDMSSTYFAEKMSPNGTKCHLENTTILDV